jgi:hypothetical protein
MGCIVLQDDGARHLASVHEEAGLGLYLADIEPVYGSGTVAAGAVL